MAHRADTLTWTFTATIWQHAGAAAWHFVTLPIEVADDIEALTTARSVAFGSVPVQATIGATAWTTSLFPSSHAGSYLLPLKADVRRREGLVAGHEIAVELVVVA